jgi:hypothetical protein
MTIAAVAMATRRATRTHNRSCPYALVGFLGPCIRVGEQTLGARGQSPRDIATPQRDEPCSPVRAGTLLVVVSVDAGCVADVVHDE